MVREFGTGRGLYVMGDGGLWVGSAMGVYEKLAAFLEASTFSTRENVDG